MDFYGLEDKGKKLLEQYPRIKHAAKRLYQLGSVTLSSDKMKSEGNLVRLTPDDGFEYFYGYYDKSPWDATDRYIIALKVRQTYKNVAPKEPGTICVIDTETGKVEEIASTSSWNVQQGCMAQWLGPDFASRIIYNDFRNGHYCSVIYSWQEHKEEKELPIPVYDVAKDGTFGLSLDFSRLHRMRPGYGYSNLPDLTKDMLCPNETCIWKINLDTGNITELFKYSDFAAFEPDESMAGAEHKVNHIMISPNGKRFMVLHRWFQKGRKHSRLVTVNVDKTEMYNLSDDVFVSHCFWKNDNEILGFLRKKETGNHYYLMKDKSQEYRMLWPELKTDGHCSYSPDRKLIVTDTYPNRKRVASVFVCREEDDTVERVARVYSPFKYDNDCRCDLHPRWNQSGDLICIDSVHKGLRGMYIMIACNDISCYDNRPLVSFILPFFNSRNTIARTIESVVNQCSDNWELILINDGSTDDTMQIVEKYLNRQNVLLVSQPNSGPGIARNRGIRLARGEYLMFVDSDDYLELDCVTNISQYKQKDNPDVIFFDWMREDENGKELGKGNNYKYRNLDKNQLIHYQMTGKMSWGLSKIIKKGLIIKNNIQFDSFDVGEEARFSFQILKAAETITFIDDSLYHYTFNSNGQHKKGGVDPWWDTTIEMKKYLEMTSEYELYRKTINSLAVNALTKSLYRCCTREGITNRRNIMKSQIQKYKGTFDLSDIDVKLMDGSTLFIYILIKLKLLNIILILATIKNKI